MKNIFARRGERNSSTVLANMMATVKNGAEEFSRALLSRFSSSLDGDKKINESCGYPQVLTIDHYYEMWKREGIATRAVELFADESWRVEPEVYESEKPTDSEFEKAWKNLVDERQVYHYMHRADATSNIGNFGILLLGLNDGGKLEEPVTKKNLKLIYLREFYEPHVKIDNFESDTSNPRYGLPTMYSVEMSTESLVNGTNAKQTQTVKVHHSRVIHIADDRRSSDVFGRPRMQTIYNRLYDLRKIAGGSGEMFWRGGFMGFSIEVNEGVDAEIDQEATAKQVKKFTDGLDRFIGVDGCTVKTLSPSVADPRGHIDVQIELVCIALAAPKRVFIGSEQAQLASEQDSKSWNNRISRRQKRYVGPMMLSPFIHRMVEYGVLPEPKNGKFHIFWPDMNATGEKEKSEIARNRTECIVRYVQGGGAEFVPPEEFATMFLGMSAEEADQIKKSRNAYIGLEDNMPETEDNSDSNQDPEDSDK